MTNDAYEAALRRVRGEALHVGDDHTVARITRMIEFQQTNDRERLRGEYSELRPLYRMRLGRPPMPDPTPQELTQPAHANPTERGQPGDTNIEGEVPQPIRSPRNRAGP